MYYCKNRNSLVTTTNGKVTEWKKEDSKWVVTSSFPLLHPINRSLFSINETEEFICFGDHTGSMYIYHLDTGNLLRKLKHRQAKYEVRMCMFSPNPDNKIYQVGDSPHLLCWEYVDPKVISEYENNKLSK